MSKQPILVLQMQRMGDLILSFPLFLWLERTYPGHPIWVVAGENFFRPLMNVSPAVTYFPWSGLDVLRQHKYELIVNLSIVREAADLAGELEADTKFGPVSFGEASYILGDWHLYRASVVENNRHNHFHWADLNALDCIPLERMKQTGWSQPRTLNSKDGRVGLFLGASESAKRPSVKFWSDLCSELLGRGMYPVLFGGPLEQGVGQEVARIFGGPVLDMCGKLSLEEIITVGQSLELFITPDTGPMHLAAWSGMKVLNLSMGNVNPWETGPYQSEHYVFRSTMSCALGCWSCKRERLYCHAPFTPSRIAVMARRIIRNDSSSIAKMNMPGLRVYGSSRNDNGLYHLDHLSGSKSASGDLLGFFWQQYFGAVFGLWDLESAKRIWTLFADSHPALAEKMCAHLPRLGREFSRGLARGQQLPDSFWNSCPLILRQFSGFIHLFLQNNDYNRAAWVRVLSFYEVLLSVLGKG